MKKIYSYLAVAAMAGMLLTACATKTTEGTPTEVPTPTAVPTEPADAPTPTEVPKATEAPKTTEAPKATEAPKVTQAPVETEFTYDFNDLVYTGSYGTVYEVKGDGSIDLQFEGQYQEIKLAIPKEIDMSYCYQVTVKALSSYGPLSFKLYDGSGTQIFVEYYLKGDTVTEYKLAPSISDTAAGIGLMALDTVDDFSLYKATVYSVTFHMDEDYASAGQELQTAEDTYSPIVTDGTNLELEAKWKAEFEGLTMAETLKKIGYDTPLMTQRFGADPCALVYDGRVYIYMTADAIEYDAFGNAKDNSYGKISSLNVISSDDLVNWTDHGSIYAAGRKGAATWGGNSWAPAAACKEIDGQMKFFVYFANGGNGIGVLTSDSPTGPFIDPLGKALISRATPNCSNVDWLFDPAVLVDDDGSAYIYFGGGVPAGKAANPGTGRVAKLGDDMISLACDPVAIEIPYLFEDSGINKIGDTYFYSYCTNWNVNAEATKEYGFTNANIAYMTSDNPMGPFTYQGVVLKHPGSYFPGDYNNNHHAIFEFNGEWYITYHTRILASGMGVKGLNYRSTHITKINVNEEGLLDTVTKANRESLVQQKSFNPYEKVEAETMATMGGLNTTQEGDVSEEYGSGNMALTDINSGDWLALYGVDFGETGATKFMAAVKTPAGQSGAIQIRLDSLDGEVIGYLDVGTGADGTYHEVTVDLLKQVTGEHTLIFVFCGEGYQVDYWQFR